MIDKFRNYKLNKIKANKAKRRFASKMQEIALIKQKEIDDELLYEVEQEMMRDFQYYINSIDKKKKKKKNAFYIKMIWEFFPYIIVSTIIALSIIILRECNENPQVESNQGSEIHSETLDSF